MKHIWKSFLILRTILTSSKFQVNIFKYSVRNKSLFFQSHKTKLSRITFKSFEEVDKSTEMLTTWPSHAWCMNETFLYISNILPRRYSKRIKESRWRLTSHSAEINQGQWFHLRSTTNILWDIHKIYWSCDVSIFRKSGVY
jgi:hypothetical protein